MRYSRGSALLSVSALAVGLSVGLAPSPASAAFGSGTGWVPPPNSQVGSGNLPVQCTVKVAGIGLQTATAYAQSTGAVPAVLHPGQSWNISNGKADVVLPASLSNLLNLIGVQKIAPTVTEASFLEQGANTASVNAVASNTIVVPPVTIVPNTPISIKVGYDRPLTIGPFPAPNAGITHVALGAIKADVTAYLGGGIQIPLPITTECPVTDPLQLLATINVGGTPSTGTVTVPGDYPAADVPENAITGSTGAQYQCHFGSASVPVEVAMTASGSFGSKGLAASPGEKFDFEGNHGQMILPASSLAAVRKAVRARPGGAKAVAVRPTLTVLEVTGVNVTPAAANFLPAPVPGETLSLTGTTAASVHFPVPGETIDPFTFTAGRSGIIDVFLGAAAATVQPIDAQGAPAGTPISVTCPAPTPIVPLFPAEITAN